MANVYETLISVLDKTAAPILAIEERLKHLGNTGHATQKALVMSPHQKLWSELTEHVMAADELFKGLGEHIHEMGDRLSEVLPMLAGLGAVGSAAGLVELVHGVAEAAEALQVVSKITGASTGQLQEFGYAAGTVGVPLDALNTGLERLNVRIGRAAEGQDKNSAKLFHKMGISLKDAQGHVKTLADIWPQLTKSFEDTTDPAVRSAMAMQLFGRSGLDLLPFLNLGPQKLKELSDQFDKFGYKKSDEDNENLEQFNIGWKKAALSVQGLEDVIASRLAPVLTPLLNDFATFVAQNRELVAADLKDAIEEVSGALEKMPWQKIHDDTRLVIHVSEDFIAKIGGIQNAVIGVGGVLFLNFLAPIISLGIQIGVTGASMALFAGTQVVKFGAALLSGAKDVGSMADAWQTLKMAFMSNPLGALITGFIAIGVLGYIIYEHWDKITQVFKDLGAEMQNVINKAGDVAKSLTFHLGGDPSSGGFEAALPGAKPFPAVAGPASQNGRVDVNITHANMPPGTQVQTKTSGNVATPVTKKGYASMAGGDF